jgi:hypothetical protein
MSIFKSLDLAFDAILGAPSPSIQKRKAFIERKHAEQLHMNDLLSGVEWFVKYEHEYNEFSICIGEFCIMRDQDKDKILERIYELISY